MFRATCLAVPDKLREKFTVQRHIRISKGTNAARNQIESATKTRVGTSKLVLQFGQPLKPVASLFHVRCNFPEAFAILGFR